MVRCQQCQKELKLVTGGATIRLYRCESCGSQQMLPGDGEEAGAPAAATAQAAPPIEDPIRAAQVLIAENRPPSGKISPGVWYALAAIVAAVLVKAIIF